MVITRTKVKQYNSTRKIVVCVDGVPVCITTSSKRAADIAAYLEGYDVEIADGKIKRQLDKVRGGHLNGSKGESGACKV